MCKYVCARVFVCVYVYLYVSVFVCTSPPFFPAIHSADVDNDTDGEDEEEEEDASCSRCSSETLISFAFSISTVVMTTS